jgi:hypothetical protein
LANADGYAVSLAGFFLGAWPNIDRRIAWPVIDLATNLEVDSGAPIVSGVGGLVELIGLSSTAGFRILFGPDDHNGGSNDITSDFRHAGLSEVPVPGGLLLLDITLGGLALARRRRMKAA